MKGSEAMIHNETMKAFFHAEAIRYLTGCPLETRNWKQY